MFIVDKKIQILLFTPTKITDFIIYSDKKRQVYARFYDYERQKLQILSLTHTKYTDPLIYADKKNEFYV